jgi:uncharacterized membrane protein YgdD (TMEM256/DUF423 family)
MERRLFVAGAIVAMLSVAIGAFGAHGLEGRLDARAMASFQTAARYQFFHAFGLIAAAFAAARYSGRAPGIAGLLFGIGLLLFCGSLYALALGSPRAFGAIAPLGGLSFMAGWGALALAAWRG